MTDGLGNSTHISLSLEMGPEAVCERSEDSDGPYHEDQPELIMPDTRRDILSNHVEEY
jgi:hypothetical protein